MLGMFGGVVLLLFRGWNWWGSLGVGIPAGFFAGYIVGYFVGWLLTVYMEYRQHKEWKRKEGREEKT